MGATYTRQSSAGITDGAVIEASDLNDEFDQLLAAFVAASGHTHDGTDAEGGPVTKLLGNTLTFGAATAGTDITITFDGETSDGVLYWMEDEDHFKFADDIVVDSTKRLYFNDEGGEYIYGDGTDLYLTSGADINIPANIGMTFGNDGEKIEGDGTDLTITGNTINLTATTDVALAVNTGLLLAGTEKIESDGTDLSITVGAGGDINIGTDIGLTFGNDGEKIEGDGTDLTIAGNNINLTAVADVVIPADVGITFGTGEKIEGNNTDLTITSGADIALTATADVNLPNNVGMVFGDDGEKIEGDGTNLTISSSGHTYMNMDGGSIYLTKSGTQFGYIQNASDDLSIKSQISNQDILLKGNDGGATITALTLDMSEAGAATFNNKVVATELDISGAMDIDGTSNLDAVDIDGAVQIDGTVTVGVDDTGLDVKFFGASAGAYGLYDQSENAFEVRGATAAGAGLLKLTTGELTVVDADKLGRIDFQAPLESDGTDSVAIAASIWAEADDTFSATVNNTDLVFALGKSEAAAEKFRLTADGEIGLGGANYGTDGQVLTSAGAGAAAAWEDSSGVAGKVEGTNFTDSLLVGHSTTGTLNAAEDNTGVGIDALDALTSGDNNTAVGSAAGSAINSGIRNTVIGSIAGDAVTTGRMTTAVGYSALTTVSTNDYNTAVGAYTLSAATGVSNTALGKSAGALVAAGAYNIMLGYQAGDNITSGDGNVCIGVDADPSSATGDRQLIIQGSDTSTTTTWITGDSSGNLVFPADVTLGDDLVLDSDSAVLKFGDDQDVTLTHTDGTGLTLNSTSKLCFQDTGTYVGSNADGDLDVVSDGTAVDSINLESAGGVTLDAGTASSGIIYEDDGTEMLRIHNSSSDVIVEAKVQDKDIIFKGDDGGSGVTALTLDMSAGGIATFSAAANVAQQAITSSSNAVAWDASDKPNAYHITTENTTFSAPSNAVEGAFICLEINFNGSHTIGWNTVFEFAASTEPTETATDAKTDLHVFRYNGAVWQEVGRTLNLSES